MNRGPWLMTQQPRQLVNGHEHAAPQPGGDTQGRWGEGYMGTLAFFCPGFL